MDNDTFEGTLVLEKLASIGKTDEFFDAVDSDDFAKARKLMRLAGVDTKTIGIVLEKMADPDQEN